MQLAHFFFDVPQFTRIIYKFIFFATDCLINVLKLPESIIALTTLAPSILQVVYDMFPLPSQAKAGDGGKTADGGSKPPMTPREAAVSDRHTFSQ